MAYTGKISQLHNDLVEECRNNGSDDADITSVLDRHGYEEFSDDEKILLMTGEVLDQETGEYA